MKRFSILLMALGLAMAPTAMAADYTFQTEDNTDYYHSTGYEIIYGSEYNYGGTNIGDVTDHTPLLPGILSPTSPQTANSSGTTISAYDGAATGYMVSAAYTPISQLLQTDGSIGTVTIASLGIFMKVYEGTTNQSMDKGLGHFSESSGWEGNVALCGHNRGSQHNIGSIKNMKVGDIIEYTTLLGTRRYAVAFVGTISSTDWSYIASSSDNRITLITCLADQPTLRVAVQAVEIK